MLLKVIIFSFSSCLLSNSFYCSQRSYMAEPQFGPSCAIRVTKCDMASTSTIKKYSICFEGKSLVTAAQRGISFAHAQSPNASNPMDLWDPLSSTQRSFSIPFSVVARTLPLLVHPIHRGLIPVSLSSFMCAYYTNIILDPSSFTLSTQFTWC